MSVATSNRPAAPARPAHPPDPPPTAPRRAPAIWAVALGLFGGALAVYMRTLRPTVGWLDSAELTTAAYHLGIGHNPGYPTFMLVGHLFSWLPVGSIAYRLNLMAAVMGALAVALLYLVCLRVTRNRIASALAALTAAFSYTLWDVTIEAEVYTLHACFMLGIMLLLLRWRDASGDRDLYLACALTGVSLGNHPLTLLLMPALGLLVALDRGLRYLWPRKLWVCLGALAGGALVYLYVPLRAMADPPPQVNDPHTLHQFWELITAPGYHKVMASMTAAQVALRALGFARHGVRELGPCGLAAALLGIGLLIRSDRKLAAALLVLAGLDVLYAINYDIFDIYTYFLPAYLVLAVFMAIGLTQVIAWIERGMAWPQRGVERSLTRPSRIALAAALLTYLPVSVFAANLRLVDASRDCEADDFALAALQVVEPGAVIIGDWYSIAPLGYLKHVEGLRPDVTLSVALSAFDAAETRKALAADYLASFPAAYIAEHQTAWTPTLKRRYLHDEVGDLLRLYPHGKPRLRAKPGHGTPAYRVGDTLSLLTTECAPARVRQGAVLRITHRWVRLAGMRDDIETLTSIVGLDGCIWRVRSELANGFYDADTWRPREVAEEQHVAFIPDDAQPGDYSVTVRARSKDTKRPLPAFRASSAEAASNAAMATIHIVARRPRSATSSFAPRHW